MLVSVLGSGSKGNCTYVAGNDQGLLIDAGLSWKQTHARANDKGLDLEKIRSILITHRHWDHYVHAERIARELAATIYWPEDLIDVQDSDIGYVVFCGFSVSVNDISHDRSGFSLTIKGEKNKLVYVTDTGILSPELKKEILVSTVLILESNHDEKMLRESHYPQHLIDRIESDIGHLSNLQAAEAVKTLDPNVTKHVILAHISEENNTTEKINDTFSKTLGTTHPMLHVATQKDGSSTIDI